MRNCVVLLLVISAASGCKVSQNATQNNLSVRTIPAAEVLVLDSLIRTPTVQLQRLPDGRWVQTNIEPVSANGPANFNVNAGRKSQITVAVNGSTAEAAPNKDKTRTDNSVDNSTDNSGNRIVLYVIIAVVLVVSGSWIIRRYL